MVFRFMLYYVVELKQEIILGKVHVHCKKRFLKVFKIDNRKSKQP